MGKKRRPGGGRRRKPVAEKELNGTYRPYRDGERELGTKAELKTLGAYRAPQPPKEMSSERKKIWRALAKELQSKRLPKKRDLTAFRILVDAIDRYNKADKNIEDQDPASMERKRVLGEMKSSVDIILKTAPLFGLDPLSARNVKVPLGAGAAAAEAGSGKPKEDEGPDLRAFVPGAG